MSEKSRSFDEITVVEGMEHREGSEYVDQRMMR